MFTVLVIKLKVSNAWIVTPCLWAKERSADICGIIIIIIIIIIIQWVPGLSRG